MGFKTKSTMNSHSEDCVSTNPDTNASKEPEHSPTNPVNTMNNVSDNSTADNATSGQPQTSQSCLHHSATDPDLHPSRPHSAHQHHHRIIGRLLRVMGDNYCYSCGIALRQMGDQLAGEYEVRRAFSTGDIPNSIKNS